MIDDDFKSRPFCGRGDVRFAPNYCTIRHTNQKRVEGMNEGDGKMTDLRTCPFCECEISVAIKDYRRISSQQCYSIVYSLVHPDNGCILEGYESRETSARGELVDKWNRRVIE